jgi:hypothetical protein
LNFSGSATALLKVAIGDWVVVKYGKNGKKFVGRIKKLNKAKFFVGEFVRPKFTKLKTGHVFHFPDIPDVGKFRFKNIVRVLPAPKPYFCGCFLFDISYTSM